MTLGPEQRALFADAGAALYTEVLGGGLAADDPRIADGGPLRSAFDVLVELGLLSLDDDSNRWVAQDPASAAARVVAPMSNEGSRLLQESGEWTRAFADLTHAWRRSPRSDESGPFTHLRGSAIDRFLDGLVAESETEILTAQPQAGRNAQSLAIAAERDIQALERGIKIRTLYQHSARRSSATHDYVRTVTDRGAEVRTLDEFFNRMIIVDQRVAVIPGAEDLSVAVAVREASVVTYLMDVFERSWDRGRPFANRETSMLKSIAAEQRAMTVRMLIEGHADPVSAKRLGVSPRTYAGYVADLKEEYEAETRFQLGYTMGRLGITGNDDPVGS
ncbi:LuxR family transcriptional regulator [Nocardioides acrostichi]|uniref:LuxR family transcriptional regulator n=1 Tax=Nocardioides acrostichi TaxID=2784339 RepID=A0A930Y948_9ACTN|nr:LuxR family transcriptional regulator [Nocardioides acrostichi]MBF4163746.1 LuxR family transcriptional regulator [Nocardioides acrostichi]